MIALMTIAFVSLFVALGLQRSNVVSSTQDRFPRLSDKSCLDEAVQKTPGVKFRSSKETFDSSRTAWNTEISITRYRIEYDIENGKPFDNGSIGITESASDDPSPSYNYVTYSNTVGDTNDPKPTGEELEKTQSLMQDMNTRVKESCKIDDFNPTILN